MGLPPDQGILLRHRSLPVHFESRLLISEGRDALPVMTLGLGRGEATIDLEHHDGVGMTQLFSNNFGGRADTDGADGEGVSMIPLSVIFESDRETRLTVRLPGSEAESETFYEFDRTLEGVNGWRERDNAKAFLTSKQLAETYLRRLLDRLHRPYDVRQR